VQGAGFLQETKQLYTPAGTPLISGAGYVGANPVGFGGPPAGPGTHVDWIFATGPVEVRLAEGYSIRTIPIKQQLERDVNVVTFRAERFGLAVWDTDLQVGIPVDWSLQ
jgi:hypothetical protein